MPKQVANSINQIDYDRYERDPHDWYCETKLCVDQLLDYIRMPLDWSVLDPAVGRGNIPDRLIKRRHDIVHGSDLVYRDAYMCGRFPIVDFLDGNDGGYHPSSYDAVLMNPPFYHSEGAVAFIDGSLRVARHVVAALVPISFLASQARRKWFRDAPGLQILFLSKRPSMPPGTTLAPNEEGKSGKRDYCWLVFRKGKKPQPPWWL